MSSRTEYSRRWRAANPEKYRRQMLRAHGKRRLCSIKRNMSLAIPTKALHSQIRDLHKRGKDITDIVIRLRVPASVVSGVIGRVNKTNNERILK